jgi:hypothetical protein
MDLPLEYMPNPELRKYKTRSGNIRARFPKLSLHLDAAKPPAGLPPYLASLYDSQLLTREQEYHLFRKMNYLKYKAHKLRSELDVKQPKVARRWMKSKLSTKKRLK